MSLRCAFLLLLSVLALVVGCATLPFESGPAAPATAYRVGDRWVYQASDGFRAPATWVETHEVVSVGPAGISVRVTQRGDTIDTARTEEWSAPGLVTIGALYDSETRRFAMPLQRYDITLVARSARNQRVGNVHERTHREGTMK